MYLSYKNYSDLRHISLEKAFENDVIDSLGNILIFVLIFYQYFFSFCEWVFFI